MRTFFLPNAMQALNTGFARSKIALRVSSGAKRTALVVRAEGKELAQVGCVV